MLQSMELERVGHDTETQQQQLLLIPLEVLQFKKKIWIFKQTRDLQTKKEISAVYSQALSFHPQGQYSLTTEMKS